MVLCEDGECSVCLCTYSRADRVPRVLHCRHTFCQPCLETMSRAEAGLLSVACPLCRRVTCVGRGLSLQEALWVNSRLWEQIPEEKDEEEAEEKEGQLKRDDEEERMESKQQARCAPSRSARTRLRLPALLRRLRLTKQNPETIVPGSSVEIKSWRRLSAEVTL